MPNYNSSSDRGSDYEIQERPSSESESDHSEHCDDLAPCTY